MLDILSYSQELSSQAKLLLDSLPWYNSGSWTIGSEEVPGIEAREVLKGTNKLIATD